MKIAITGLLRYASAQTTRESGKSASRDLLFVLRERHPAIVDEAYRATPSLSSIAPHVVEQAQGDMSCVNAYSADVTARVQGVHELAKILRTGEGSSQSEGSRQGLHSASEAFTARLADEDEAVVAAVYQNAEALRIALLHGQKYVDAVAPAFRQVKTNQQILRHHLRNISDENHPSEADFLRQAFQRLIFACLMPSATREPIGQEEWSVIQGGNLGKLDVLADLSMHYAVRPEGDATGSIPLLVRQLAGKVHRPRESILNAGTCW